MGARTDSRQGKAERYRAGLRRSVGAALLRLPLWGLPLMGLPLLAAGQTTSCEASTSSGEPSCEAQAGNPIDVTTGNKFQREVDMPALPGVLGLELVRHYNSSSARADGAPTMIGRGWRLSYDWRLRFDPSGGDAQLVLVRGDGREVLLTRRRSGQGQGSTWTPADPSAGELRVTGAGPDSGYDWIDLSGLRRHFNRHGWLMLIEAPSGHQLQIEREAKGDITRVTDPQGRQLVMTLLEDTRALDERRFGGIQSVRTPVGVYDYRYGAPAGAATTLAQIALLQSVRHAGIERRYLHEDRRHPALLTGIQVIGRGSDGKAMDVRLASWSYDAQGRAVRSLKGEPDTAGNHPVSGQASGLASGQVAGSDAEERWRRQAAETVSLQYLTPARAGRSASEGLTVLRNSNGQISLFRHRLVAGQPRILEAYGAGCASCGAMNIRQHFDPQGQLIGLDQLQPVILDPKATEAALRQMPAGKVLSQLVIRRDALGRVLAHERTAISPGKTAATPVLRFEYPSGDTPRFPQDWRPTRVARPSVVPGRQHEWHFEYNGRGQLLSIEERGHEPVAGLALARRSTWTYQVLGGLSLLQQQDGPLTNGPRALPADSDITTLQWDRAGRFIERVDTPGGVQTRFERDQAGRISRQTIDDGFREIATSLQYSSDGRIAHQVERIERSGRLNASNGGNEPSALRQVTLRALHDALGHRSRLWDEAGRPLTQAYDPAGRLSQVSDDLGNRARWSRDGEGQLMSFGLFRPGQSLPMRAHYFWRDPLGQVSAHLHPDGRLDQWLRDPSGTPSWWLETGHALHHLQRHPSRDAKVPGLRHDDFGRWVQAELPNHGERHALHDAADRVTEISYADGTRFRFERDALGRILRRIALDPKGEEISSVHWRYEGLLPATMSNEHQTTIHLFDALGRPQGEQVRFKSLPKAVEFRHNLDPDTGLADSHQLIDGRRLTIARSDAAHGRTPETMTLRPDWAHAVSAWAHRHMASTWAHLLDRMLPGEQLLSWISVDPFDGLVRMRTAGNVITTLKRDSAGRLVSMRASGVSSWSLDYGKGPSPRRALWSPYADDIPEFENGKPASTPLGNSIINVGYQFDGAGALTGSRTHDDKTDRARVVGPPLAQGQAAPATPAGGVSVPRRMIGDARDGRGRLIQDARHLYKYNPMGLLEQVRSRDGLLVAQYHYDGSGRRITKIVHDEHERIVSTRHFVWQGELLVAELDDKGRWLCQYFYLSEYGNGSGAHAWPFAKIESGDEPDNATGRRRVIYLHLDHRGTPLAFSDIHGRGNRHADPYSDPWVQRVDADKYRIQNLRQPGHYFDAETGLHHQHYRSYDPRNHRYLQPDPLGYPDGPDAYRHAAGNPLARSDPLGLYEEDVHYYMTYFLAKVAGLSDRQSLVIAQADRYIDDNSYTQPFTSKAARAAYHFTQAGYDPAPTANDILTVQPVSARATNPRPATVLSRAYIESRIQNPSNPQLATLEGYAMMAPNPCIKAQLYGEFLHAYQDTFAHRDDQNAPYGALGGHVIAPGFPGHSPDKTYNHQDTLMNVTWDVNEKRTLRMEFEVFTMLQNDFGTRPKATWDELEPMLTAFNEDWTIEEFARFKSTRISGFLQSLGMSYIPTYNAVRSSNCRHAFLDRLDPAKYPGAILKSDDLRGDPQNQWEPNILRHLELLEPFACN